MKLKSAYFASMSSTELFSTGTAWTQTHAALFACSVGIVCCMLSFMAFSFKSTAAKLCPKMEPKWVSTSGHKEKVLDRSIIRAQQWTKNDDYLEVYGGALLLTL